MFFDGRSSRSGSHRSLSGIQRGGGEDKDYCRDVSHILQYSLLHPTCQALLHDRVLEVEGQSWCLQVSRLRRNYDVYNDAFVKGKQLLQDGLTLADCNISNLDRISELPCSLFKIVVACTIGPERLPIYEPFEVNSLELVGSLKNKIFNYSNLPANRQLLCCGDRWLSSADDEIRLLDLGIVPHFGPDHKLLDMPCLQVTAYRHISLCNQQFQLSVKVPEIKLQFCLTVHPAGTINHVKAMILQYSTFYDETHMLIFEDKNLLEDGDSALLDHGIEKEVQLVSCLKGSFLIWVSRKGSDQWFAVEVESLDTVDVLKEKIHKITDVAPENQILFSQGDKG